MSHVTPCMIEQFKVFSEESLCMPETYLCKIVLQDGRSCSTRLSTQDIDDLCNEVASERISTLLAGASDKEGQRKISRSLNRFSITDRLTELFNGPDKDDSLKRDFLLPSETGGFWIDTLKHCGESRHKKVFELKDSLIKMIPQFSVPRDTFIDCLISHNGDTVDIYIVQFPSKGPLVNKEIDIDISDFNISSGSKITIYYVTNDNECRKFVQE